jgi:hypothetical protein
VDILRDHIAEMKAQVMVNGNMIPIDKASSLVFTLGRAAFDSWRLGVFTLPEFRER